MHAPFGRLLILILILAFAATGSAAVAGTSEQTGTVRILLRGCPDGPMTAVGTNLDTCQIPLDAPDAARATGQGINPAIAVADVERASNGAYLVEVPAGTEVRLGGFEPVAHNAFVMIGVDDNLIDGPWAGRLTVGAGLTRDVVVFYWNGADGFREEAEATLEITLRGCPEGVVPSTIENPASACTVPLDAPDNARLVWDMEGGTLVANQPRLNDGTYRITGIPPFMTVGLSGFEPSVRDTYMAVGVQRTQNGVPLVDLYRGDTVRVQLYYYWAVPPPANESGTIEITLRGCPEGVDPTAIANPAEACTIPLDAPGTAGVVWGGDGQGGVELWLQPRLYDGTYLVEHVPSGRTVRLAGFAPSVRDSWYVTGDVAPTTNADAELYVEPGETYQVQVYYFNAP